MTMRKILGLYIALGVLELIILSLTPNNWILGNILLSLTLVGTLVSQEEEKWIGMGVASAFIRDLLFSTSIGLNMSGMVMAVISVLLLKKFVSSEHFLSSVFAAILGTLIYLLSLWVTSLMLGGTYDITSPLRYFLIQGPINVVISLIMFYFISKNYRKIIKNDRFVYRQGIYK